MYRVLFYSSMLCNATEGKICLSLSSVSWSAFGYTIFFSFSKIYAGTTTHESFIAIE